MIGDLAAQLRAETERANQRRLIVLAGERETGFETARRVLDAAEIPRTETTLVADSKPEETNESSGAGEPSGAGTCNKAGESDQSDGFACERVSSRGADALLGRTRTAVVLDLHEACRPNAIGRAVGAVDGGGLLVFLTPPLEKWPSVRDGFDASLAVPPYSVSEVSGTFRERLVETLRVHRGVAIVDVDTPRITHDGLTHPPPRRPRPRPATPADAVFPQAAYEACRTADQAETLGALEALHRPETAVVVEADRGRGKSSAAGLAAGALAATGRDILVTAPEYSSAAEVFARADELLFVLDVTTESESGEATRSRELETSTGGRVRFLEPMAAVDEVSQPGEQDRSGAADAVIVDEAAALPVGVLTALLDSADALAFATTVHGYEGAGRGFAVRFRERLDASPSEVVDTTLYEPIRYAPGDPIEVWAFRALHLDARPPVEPLISEATPETVEYVTLDFEGSADEALLREAFGLLVVAHYRTEPDDLARLLDAPNVSVRALCHEGHVVSVALLAREGGLSPERRRSIYEGARVKGNLLPDVLTSQLRDERAAEPQGLRVLRIATHHAARSRGLGSSLLEGIREEFDGTEIDWLGVGYGATPRLLEFWRSNGFRTVHLALTRNDRSGEHSVLMLSPLSSAGHALHDRHARWFLGRIEGVLSDALAGLDPDVIRGVLRAADAAPDFDLSAHDWKTVVSAAEGPGLSRIDPRPFRRLALAYLVGSRGDGASGPEETGQEGLSTREERLLVLRVLQNRSPDVVADRLDYDSTAECLRALGRAYRPLVERYGDEVAREERARYVE